MFVNVVENSGEYTYSGELITRTGSCDLDKLPLHEVVSLVRSVSREQWQQALLAREPSLHQQALVDLWSYFQDRLLYESMDDCRASVRIMAGYLPNIVQTNPLAAMLAAHVAIKLSW